MKPGYKTTEFWLTLAMGIAGIALIIKGDAAIGAALLGAAGVAYNGSRGLAKK